jgi:hypothetical protein
MSGWNRKGIDVEMSPSPKMRGRIGTNSRYVVVDQCSELGYL